MIHIDSNREILEKFFYHDRLDAVARDCYIVYRTNQNKDLQVIGVFYDIIDASNCIDGYIGDERYNQDLDIWQYFTVESDIY